MKLYIDNINLIIVCFLMTATILKKITLCIDFVKRQKIKDRSVMLPEQL